VRKLLAALACLSLTASAPVPVNLDDGDAAIVLVVCDQGVGSATRVTENAYISVAHVTSLGNCTVDGTKITVTHSDAEQDFSTFIGPKGKDTLDISCDGFTRLEGYVSRGHAYGDPNVWFQPVIAVAEYKGKWAFVGDIFPGMSGGPIVDKDGRITGVNNIANPSAGVDLKDTVVCGEGK
jgi:hypothetical protein